MSQEDKERPASHSAAAAASHDGLSVKVPLVFLYIVNFLAVLKDLPLLGIQIRTSLVFSVFHPVREAKILRSAADPAGPGSALLLNYVLRIRDPARFVILIPWIWDP